MMQTVNGGRPDEGGYVHFIGNPTDLQEGDLVLDGDYAVLEKKPGEHKGLAATTITYADAGEYAFENPRGGVPHDPGRATLGNGMKIRFARLVDRADVDFGAEPNIYYDHPCDNPLHGEDGEHFQTEWRGKCRDIPKGMLVGLNLKPDWANPTMTCLIVDSVYATGLVLFEDGRAYQSHPDKEWVGWV